MDEKWTNRIVDSLMDGLISIPTGILVGILLSWIGAMPRWLILFSALLAIVPILALRWEKRIEKRRKLMRHVRLFREAQETIPSNNTGNDEWEIWLLKMEAVFRGLGHKRKSDVLSSIIRRTDLPNRHEVAKDFFRGLLR